MNKCPLVILHGWNLSSGKYHQLKMHLRDKGYFVYIPDFPGFGTNQKPDKPLTLNDYADFLVKYLKDQKIHKPVLVAHSFGGRVAILTEANNPGMCRGLVLSGVPGFLPVPRAKVYFFLVIAKLGGFVFSLPVFNLISSSARKILYKLSGSTDYYNAGGALRQTFKNIIKFDLEKHIKKLKLPVLFIWGAGDQVVSLAIARKMMANIPNSKLIVHPKASHKLPYEDPVWFCQQVDDFCSKIC